MEDTGRSFRRSYFNRKLSPFRTKGRSRRERMNSISKLSPLRTKLKLRKRYCCKSCFRITTKESDLPRQPCIADPVDTTKAMKTTSTTTFLWWSTNRSDDSSTSPSQMHGDCRATGGSWQWAWHWFKCWGQYRRQPVAHQTVALTPHQPHRLKMTQPIQAPVRAVAACLPEYCNHNKVAKQRAAVMKQVAQCECNQLPKQEPGEPQPGPSGESNGASDGVKGKQHDRSASSSDEEERPARKRNSTRTK